MIASVVSKSLLQLSYAQRLSVGLPLADHQDADDEKPDLQREVGNDGDGQYGSRSDGQTYRNGHEVEDGAT